ncbi:MAG: hypoxanthine phosphoribosyltransferase [Armatimonadia bacterium]|nr:hypoxanthine phosphoribosyltransferase [Armatimonadia bacterium]
MRDDIETVLVTQEQLQAAIGRIAGELSEDVDDRNPLLVGVLIGAFVFLADLVRALDFPLEVDFINASSYGDCTEAGTLEIIADLTCDVAGRDVVLVDDIADTGQTLKALERMLHGRGAASVRTCCLLDKPARRTCDFEPQYVGVTIPDEFVVGYGLDFAGNHRNIPFVGVLRPELYQSSE